MTTQNESRLIARLDRQRESNPHLKWAHLFRARTVNPVTLRILAAFQDTKMSPSALRATGVK